MSSIPKARTIALALLLSAFSSGCASNKQPVVVVRAPPVERLTCKAEPAVPAADTDKAVAQFITDALDAGQSCRSALAWIRDWSAEVTKPKAPR